jgi:hypothetical protein
MRAAQHRTNSSRLLLIPPPTPQRLRQGVTAGSRRSSKRSSPVSQGLITVLKDELKVEKERYRTPEAVMDGPPNGFELQNRPDSTVLLLARSFGEEDIFVEVRRCPARLAGWVYCTWLAGTQTVEAVVTAASVGRHAVATAQLAWQSRQ